MLYVSACLTSKVPLTSEIPSNLFLICTSVNISVQENYYALKHHEYSRQNRTYFELHEVPGCSSPYTPHYRHAALSIGAMIVISKFNKCMKVLVYIISELDALLTILMVNLPESWWLTFQKHGNSLTRVMVTLMPVMMTLDGESHYVHINWLWGL